MMMKNVNTDLVLTNELNSNIFEIKHLQNPDEILMS